MLVDPRAAKYPDLTGKAAEGNQLVSADITAPVLNKNMHGSGC